MDMEKRVFDDPRIRPRSETPPKTLPTPCHIEARVSAQEWTNVR